LEAEGQSDQAESAVKDVGEKIKDAAAKVKRALVGRQAKAPPTRVAALWRSLPVLVLLALNKVCVRSIR
jgi:hypothetical protein